MESFFVRYRNLLVLLALLLVQIIGLAMQVRRTASGQMTDRGDGSGVRLIRLWANWIVSPPERALETSKTGVGSIWSNYFDLLHVRQENKDLQATLDRLRLEQAALLEDARQGQRLQALQGFQQKYLYTTLVAQVIGTSGSDQSRVFYINKGKDDGLGRDMAVISADGIVGKIREVLGPHTAQVLGINDQSSGAGVILESTRIRGILRGNAFGEPQIVNLLADQRIKPGERVLTAGGDQIFPRGLPVGSVQKVIDDPDRDGFIEVVIKPDAHLDSLDEVLVITATQPRFSDDQMKDLAMSQDLKGAEAAALADQQRASQIMAERLPGLTDPNAPPAANGAAQGANGSPTANGATASGGVTVVPKIIQPQHPDRFTPSVATQTGAIPVSAPKPAVPAASRPGAASGAGPGAKPATQKKLAQPAATTPAANAPRAPKPEAQPETKPETKPEARPESKPETPQPEPQQPPNPQPQEKR